MSYSIVRIIFHVVGLYICKFCSRMYDNHIYSTSTFNFPAIFVHAITVNKCNIYKDIDCLLVPKVHAITVNKCNIYKDIDCLLVT